MDLRSHGKPLRSPLWPKGEVQRLQVVFSGHRDDLCYPAAQALSGPVETPTVGRLRVQTESCALHAIQACGEKVVRLRGDGRSWILLLWTLD